MRRVRSQFLQSVFRLSLAVRGRGVSDGTAVAPSVRGSGASVGRRIGLFAACVGSLLLVGAPAAQAAKYVDRVIGNTTVGATGGLFSQPQEVAVNRTGAGGVTAGTFYVVEGNNRRVQRFAPSGAFQRAWGADVDLPAGGTNLEVCTVASNCKVGVVSAGNGTPAGNGTFAGPLGVAVDSDTGNVFVASRDARRIDVYDANGGFLRAFGFDVVASGPGNTGTGYEICVQADGDVCKTGVAGTGTGQVGDNNIVGMFDLVVTPPDGNAAAGKVYLANTDNQRVEVYNLDGTSPSNLGSSATFELQYPRDLAIGNGILYASNATDQNQVERYDLNTEGFLAPIDVSALAVDVDSTQETRGLDIDPGSGNLFVARASATAGIVEIANPATTPAFADRHLSTVVPAGVAAGPASGEVMAFLNHRVLIYNDGPTPANVTIEGTTAIEATGATLHATIDSSGSLPTVHQLQISRNGVDWTTVAGGTVAAGASQAVSATVGDLLPNTLYRIRVLANRTLGNPDVTSAESTFLTDAVKPEIVSSGADSVEQTSARLTGYVNPHSTPTTYRFEWGTESGSYPNRVPVPNGALGSGPSPTLAANSISGLQPATTYYFRLIATSSTEGTTTGPERTLTTRAAPRTPRVPELVSPPEKTPGGYVGFYTTSALVFQVAADGQSVSYPIAYGAPDSTAAGAPRYKSTRGSGGWASSQITPPMTVISHPGGSEEWAARYQFMSPDLSCGVLSSPQPLTPDAPAVVRDYNGANLFTRDQDGGYRVLTPQAPSNITDPAVNMATSVNGGYNLVGSSPSCDHVVFETPFRFAGLNSSGVYESDGGVLSDVGVRPDGTVPATVDVGSGTDSSSGTQWRAVSEDASRVYFTATSNDGNDSGNPALYLREDGVTVKVSASKTATSNVGAYYQMASLDGSKVAFLANYGLTAISSAGPAASNCRSDSLSQACALYVYDVASGDLADISADSNPANTNGPTVGGVVAASDDLSRIYFTAKGQMVAGKGRTYTQNVADGTSSLYLWDDGATRFVATVRSSDLLNNITFSGFEPGTLARNGEPRWTSQATPDGRSLVFESRGNVVGYDSGGAVEAYLYSADSGETVCVSCRPDGNPSVGYPGPLEGHRSVLNRGLFNFFSRPRNLTVDGKRVFFSSPDTLATGGVDENANIYEWDQGVVRLLTTGKAGLVGVGMTDGIRGPVLYGVSESGDDVFIKTPQALDSGDRDEVVDLYDFRIGGGFPAPVPPVTCPVLEDGCQGGGAGSVATDPKTSSAESSGGGNVSSGERGTLAVSALSAKARRKAARSGRLSLAVRTSSIGRLTLSVRAKLGERGSEVGRASKRVTKAGTVKVSVRLAPAVAKRLRSGKALRVTAEVRQAGARTRTTSILLPGVKS
jgi:hypothetical protein